jgi:hypothetical protein
VLVPETSGRGTTALARQREPAGRRNHFPSSAKSPGNEPVIPSPLIKQRGLIMYRAEPEASHEASNIIRNRSRYPSHCCNYHAVVAINSDRASCRRHSQRSVQEFSQPDRSKSFRTIALLTGIFASLKRGADCSRRSWQHKPARVNRRALIWWQLNTIKRERKITLREMRESGPTGSSSIAAIKMRTFERGRRQPLGL